MEAEAANAGREARTEEKEGRRAAACLRNQLAASCLHVWRRRSRRRRKWVRREPAGCTAGERRPGCARESGERGGRREERTPHRVHGSYLGAVDLGAEAAATYPPPQQLSQISRRRDSWRRDILPRRPQRRDPGSKFENIYSRDLHVFFFKKKVKLQKVQWHRPWTGTGRHVMCVGREAGGGKLRRRHYGT